MDARNGKPENNRFSCHFSGCTKSFTRKEHLVRHTQTHLASSRHVCQVCFREFSRSDSLQRHIARHGDVYKASPSGRVKNACAACHMSKIKCDGNQTCSRCRKKGIECVYEHQDNVAQSEQHLSGAQEHDLRDSTFTSNEQSKSFLSQQETPGRIIPRVNVPATIKHLNGESHERIGWVLASRIEQDDASVAPPAMQSKSDDNTKLLSQVVTKRYTELYFAKFHHRWPIIHAPTYEAEGPNIMKYSLLIIGAWLDGSSESKEFALTSHGKLHDQISQQLAQISSEDTFDQSLSPVLCQAALLNIIFGIYCGREKIISKSIIMCSILMAALREVCLFTSEIPYSKPGVFPPFRLFKLAERQRTAAYLFKIDSYLSLLRSQPPSLRSEELHFPLTSTYSLHNADGLHTWEIRHLVEPEARAQKSIHQLIQDTDLNSCVPANGMMLIEDIQLGLCAVQPDIWQLREQIRRGTDVNNTIRQDFLRRKLELWKRWIDRIPLRPCDYTTLSEEQHMAMRFYYGMEDHSVSGWQAEVLGRPCDLIFDAFMLYQLLSLHLLADVRIFCQLVRDRIDTTLAVNFGPPYEQERLHRETTTREWTMTELARRALYHSANVLVAYESLPVAINQTVDPITFLALSVSAMVIWAYCTFGESDCRVCSGRPPGTRSTPVPGRTHALELTEVRDSEMVHGEKVIWVEKGNRQLAIFGIQLCRCNKGSLVARFNSCLPEGWDLAQYSTGSA